MSLTDIEATSFFAFPLRERLRYRNQFSISFDLEPLAAITKNFLLVKLILPGELEVLVQPFCDERHLALFMVNLSLNFTQNNPPIVARHQFLHSKKAGFSAYFL